LEKAKHERKLISSATRVYTNGRRQMSFKLGLNSIPELLVLGLMFVFVFAVLYSNIDFTYKIGVTIIIFSIILLTSVASQALKQLNPKKQ
jgi:hypothetical protein